MKVAVSGKGGTGKTTIAATLARCLARRGYRVLAIDGVATLVDEYAIAGPDGIRLVLAAKVDQAGGG